MDRRGAALGAWIAALAGPGGLAGCDVSLSHYDDIYSRGAEHFVLCSQNLDNKNNFTAEEIGAALTRAKLEGTTLHLYAHRPGDTVDLSTIEEVLASAVERGVGFVTYDELSAGEAPGTVALAFDDHNVASWMALRPMLDHYHARVTFFISAFNWLEDEDKDNIRRLADDGHDIEFHSVRHKNAEAYAAKHGVEAYVADDILPALEAMRAAGYPTRIFAYPYGVRTAELDAALARYFVHVRAIHTTCPR